MYTISALYQITNFKCKYIVKATSYKVGLNFFKYCIWKIALIIHIYTRTYDTANI